MNFTDAQKPIRLPCYMLGPEPRNQHFIGQEQILQLMDGQLLPRENSLDDPTTSLRIFALCGMGGIGKTQIATEFMHSRREKFDAVFWVGADEANSIDHGFFSIAVELGLLDQTEDLDRIVSKNLVHAWLNQPYKNSAHPAKVRELGGEPELANWLIVFDDVYDVNILRDYVENDCNGSILITSRDPQAKHFMVQNAGVDVGPLNSVETSTLLQRLAYTMTDDKDVSACNQLARILGGHPLATAKLGQHLNCHNRRYSDCLEAYTDGTLFKALDSTGMSKGRNSLASVWAFESMETASLCLLQILAVLGSDSVHESILESEDGLKQLAKLPMFYSPYSHSQARAQLASTSLAERNVRDHIISVHPLVQEAVRAYMTPERLGTIFACAVNLLELSCPRQMELASEHIKSTWGKIENIMPHVCALKALYDHRKPNLDAKSLEQYASLVSRVAT
jgi:hypothetical protein